MYKRFGKDRVGLGFFVERFLLWVFLLRGVFVVLFGREYEGLYCLLEEFVLSWLWRVFLIILNVKLIEFSVVLLY